ncbi:MAG: 5'-deoxynucleotidase [Ruminococcus sp.]|nr:5'-deoxynucleotidase [Ruminococcus sp.]MBR7008983.1 5'-deoxynucleotidase [Ruminococcus sp.]
MDYKFFAVISRMKYIDRWALMRNTIKEDISQHSLDVAFISHALALIRNKRFGGDVSPERCALLAIFHDTTEIITGDLPTPIKYYNKQIKGAYDEIEQKAKDQLISYLPEYLREDYEPLFCKTEQEAELWQIVKAADKISALIKCLEERKMGNTDFASAEKATREAVEKMQLPEANVFLEEFIPAYELTLDEQA